MPTLRPAAALTLLLLVLGGALVPGVAAARPNIVIVQTDDQNLDAARARFMPKLHRQLRRQGIEFPNYFLSMPLCCPSRATLLSGQYAHNNRVLGNNPHRRGGFPAFADRRTLAVWLDKVGYRTAMIGKYLNFYGLSGHRYIPPGWDEWHVPPGNSTYRMFNYTVNVNGDLVHRGSAPADYQTDYYRRRARDFIRREGHRRRPFFLMVNPLAPHSEAGSPEDCHGPRPAPRHRHRFQRLRVHKSPSFNEADVDDKPVWIRRRHRFNDADRAEVRCSYRRQRRSLLAVDDLIDSVVDNLRRTGQLGKTFVFFTSDNGYMSGEHRIPNGKSWPYLESVNVPLIVRGPGIRSGVRSEQVASNADIAATVLDLANARGRATVPLDGISLEPYLLHRHRPNRRFILLEYFDDVSFRPYRGVQSDRFTFVRYHGQRPVVEELYDLDADPFQLENVAGRGDYAETRRMLKRQLRRLRSCRGRSCRGYP